ncbi:hypothetical protein NKCBBBOE_02023 [Pseudarthrobacter sp. MM222]|nr:hypothetical protein NKCBBBOE_02023 [Pseudarthrobacter sp. MM222]
MGISSGHLELWTAMRYCSPARAIAEWATSGMTPRCRGSGAHVDASGLPWHGYTATQAPKLTKLI